MLAPVVIVKPAAPGVNAVTSDPPFTVTAFIATVLSELACCVICNVNVDTPDVGTFVKSISVIFSVSVITPVLQDFS